MNLLCCTGRLVQRPAVVNTGRMGAAGGGKEVQEGEDICIHTADSVCCIAEINTAL